MSHYAGLDVSMKETSIAIINEKGKIVFETACETDPQEIATTLNNSGFHLEKVGLETGCLSFWLMDGLKEIGIKATCIEARQMATIIKLKVNKTDRIDAQLIADAMRCNLYKEVHHKTKESIEIGLQMGVRRTLINTRTKLKNSIRGYLKAYGVRLGQISHEKFSKQVRIVTEGFGVGVQIAIESLLTVYETTCTNIKNVEEQLALLLKEDPIIELFQSIPGVGAITAATYKAMIDDPFRFEDHRDVGAYLGMTPTQYSSGETIKQGSVSRCGCGELRSLLAECGMVILTRTHGWTKLKAWGLKIQKRSGLKKASVAVGRKLAVIMLVMWKENRAFIWGEKPKKAVCA
jgi:transposase